MKIYSHRGEGKFAPENTLKSFFLADYLKDDGIECDIRRTKDGKIVLIHDMSINRTSNGLGFVKNINYKDIIKYNYGAKDSFERIVTLEEYLYFFSNKKMYLYIEIKEIGYENEILNIINKYNYTNITLISFNHNILKNIRKINSTIKIGWIVFDYNELVKNKTKEIKINELLCPSLMITKEKIDDIKNNDIIPSAWALINIKELDYLKKIGVENVIYSSAYLAKKYLGDL